MYLKGGNLKWCSLELVHEVALSTRQLHVGRKLLRVDRRCRRRVLMVVVVLIMNVARPARLKVARPAWLEVARPARLEVARSDRLEVARPARLKVARPA
jgi:hypothetical protein